MEDFAETHAMSDVELRALLGSADARSRVFAVWALALRAASLVGHLAGEPDPGVRRALAVVLASHGELDLIVMLSRHDPNVYVRASASQIVVRLAKAGRVPWVLVAERFDDHAEVRAAVVSQLDAAAPDELQLKVVACLDDEDEAVRREAFESTLKLYVAGRVRADVLVEYLERSRLGERTNALALWFAIEIPTAVLSATSRSVREAALRLRTDLPLADLCLLIGDDVDICDRLERDFDLRAAPLSLVVRLATHALWNAEYVEAAIARLAECDHVAREMVPLLVALRERCDDDMLADEGDLVSCDDDTPATVERRLLLLRAELDRTIARS